MSVSPLLSMAVVEVLEAMICKPHGETTQYTVFVELLRQVAGLRRRLFSLFAHPAEGVRETVAVIMRTIAEEDAIAAESMRDAALRDGALLRHLLHAFFLPAGERREVSRQLVALWADSYQPALDLLSRVLPPGLVAYLHTRCAEVEDTDNLNDPLSTSISRRQRRLLQQRKRRAVKSTMTEDQVLPSGNANDIGDSPKQTGASRGSEQRPSPDMHAGTNSSTVHAGENSNADMLHSAPQHDNLGAPALSDGQSASNEVLDTDALDSVDSDVNLGGLQNSGKPKHSILPTSRFYK